MNYAQIRRHMVQTQLIPRGIINTRVLAAFEKVERHLFIPEKLREYAYDDHPVPIDQDQTISQPYIVALMTELLHLTGKERVLEIGTGSGYQTAVLAELSKEVYTVERFTKLSDQAQHILHAQGYRNISFKTGDGTLGWEEKSPFDRIIITAAAGHFPQPLEEQLGEGGIIEAPLGEIYSQMLTIGTKHDGTITQEQVTSCIFVPLVGKYGLRHG